MAVVVPIVTEWNPKGLERALADIEKAEGALGKTKAGLESAFLPAAGALAAVGGAMVLSAEKAAGLEQAMSKVEHVFGAAGDELIAWSENAPEALGLTQKEALSTAFIFGQFADAAGLAGSDLTGFSENLTTLASDLAAIEGVDTGTAVNALASGLRGSYEPLRQFGILLSQAEVNAKAVDMGLAETTDAVDQSARAIAAAALIQEKGAFANGFFADSAGNLIVEQQKLKATMEQTTAEIGEAFLPAVETLVGLFSGLAGWARENEGAFQALLIAVGAIAGAIVAANVALKAYEAIQLAIKVATIAWTGVQWLLNAALNANPIGIVVVAIGALVAGIIWAYNNVDWFRDLVDGAWKKIQEVTEVVFPIVKQVIETVWEWIKKAFEFTPVGFVITHWETLQEVTGTVFEAVKGAIEVVWEWIKKAFEFTPVGMVITHWEELKKATETVWNAIKTTISNVVDKITGIIDGIIGKIGDAIRKVKDFASNIPFVGGLLGSGPALGGGGDYLLNASSSGLVGASTPGIVVNVNAGVGDPLAIARTIESTLRTRGIRLGVA